VRSTSIDKIDNIDNRNYQKSCIDFYLLIDAIDNVHVIYIDSYRFIERFSDIDFYRLPTSGVLTLPSFNAFSFWYFTYCISSIEGFQPKYCSDILGNTRFSSKHKLHLCFACNTMLAGNMGFWKSRASSITTTYPRSFGIETKRDKRPLVSSNTRKWTILYTTWGEILASRSSFILISLDNMLYLETWSLS